MPFAGWFDSPPRHIASSSRIRARCEGGLRDGIGTPGSSLEDLSTNMSGFHNAPVTKVVAVVCGVATVLVGTSKRNVKLLSLSYQGVVQKLQLWRLASSTCVFTTTPELVFGLYLIYFFRVFERQIGSNKYAVFVLVTTGLSTAMEMLVLSVLRDPTSLSSLNFAPGPYGMIFASFVPFFFDIPVTTRFRVFGVPFSDKSFIYLAGLQLLLCSWTRSLIPGLCGVLAGFTYRSNIFGIKKWKFPQRVASFFAGVFSPFMSRRQSLGPRDPPNAAARGGRLVEGPFAAATGPAPAPARAAPLPPPEESVATLVSMGFDRSMAVQALGQARNDLNVATNILLEQSAR